jgi:NitT/TauT family transport system substrate-binding protein
MTNTANRRDFLARSAALAAASLLPFPTSAQAEPPPETKRIRLLHMPAICLAPQYLAEELLRLEGFEKVEYVSVSDNDNLSYITSDRVDATAQDSSGIVGRLDAGDPIMVLAGLHAGCYELFGNDRVPSVRELKGSRVAIGKIGDGDHRFISILMAYIGLDPRKDAKWIEAGTSAKAMRLFVEGKADVFFGFPPHPQELRMQKVGKVILNTTEDKPWSQYFCCMLTAHRDFVRKYPIAAKRVTRAFLKAADVCAQEPERAARLLVAKGYEPRYDVALEVLKSVPYARWRDAHPEDTLRFHALRQREVGMIKSTPQKVIARGTDWRILNELKKELKA